MPLKSTKGGDGRKREGDRKGGREWEEGSFEACTWCGYLILSSQVERCGLGGKGKEKRERRENKMNIREERFT